MALRARTAMSSEAPRRIDGSDWAVRSIYALHRWMAVLYMPSAISQGGWLCFICPPRALKGDGCALASSAGMSDTRATQGCKGACGVGKSDTRQQRGL